MEHGGLQASEVISLGAILGYQQVIRNDYVLAILVRNPYGNYETLTSSVEGVSLRHWLEDWSRMCWKVREGEVRARIGASQGPRH